MFQCKLHRVDRQSVHSMDRVYTPTVKIIAIPKLLAALAGVGMIGTVAVMLYKGSARSLP